MKSLKALLFSDPRNAQILFLASMLSTGQIALDWNLPLMQIAAIIIAATILQVAFIYKLKLGPQAIKSGLITALGVCLILRSEHIWILVLAVVVGISSKYFIKNQGKHFINPANLAVVLPTLVLSQSWISPGQWGSQILWPIIFGGFGILILIRVKRLAVGLSFLLTFAFLQYVRSVFYLEWPHDLLFHKISSGTLLLFSFFMITDPRTTPSHYGAACLWAAAIAVISFVLLIEFKIFQAPLYVLFFGSFITPMIDRVLVSNHFKWKIT